MSKEHAENFFDRLATDKKMQVRVKDGLEKLAKEFDFDVTQEELNEELRRRWGLLEGEENMYSEPPGF